MSSLGLSQTSDAASFVTTTAPYSAVRDTRGRGWLVTQFDVDDRALRFWRQQFPDERVRGVAWQLETCPDTGRRHLQGYVECRGAITRRTLQQYIGVSGVHCEQRRGTRQQAIDYCTKEATRCSDTQPTIAGLETALEPGRRSDISIFVERIRDGATDAELLDEFPVQFLRYGQHASRVRRANQPIVAIAEPKEVIVITGPSGVGKTRKAAELAGNGAYWLERSNGDNSWWDGYDAQETVVIDEFYGWIRYGKLMRILDRYPVQVEIKGSMTPLTGCKRIIFTSNQDPTGWYHYNETTMLWNALARRITQTIVMTVQQSSQ